MKLENLVKKIRKKLPEYLDPWFYYQLNKNPFKGSANARLYTAQAFILDSVLDLKLFNDYESAGRSVQC